MRTCFECEIYYKNKVKGEFRQEEIGRLTKGRNMQMSINHQRQFKASSQLLIIYSIISILFSILLYSALNFFISSLGCSSYSCALCIFSLISLFRSCNQPHYRRRSVSKDFIFFILISEMQVRISESSFYVFNNLDLSNLRHCNLFPLTTYSISQSSCSLQLVRLLTFYQYQFLDLQLSCQIIFHQPAQGSFFYAPLDKIICSPSIFFETLQVSPLLIIVAIIATVFWPRIAGSFQTLACEILSSYLSRQRYDFSFFQSLKVRIRCLLALFPLFLWIFSSFKEAQSTSLKEFPAFCGLLYTG